MSNTHLAERDFSSVFQFLQEPVKKEDNWCDQQNCCYICLLQCRNVYMVHFILLFICSICNLHFSNGWNYINSLTLSHGFFGKWNTFQEKCLKMYLTNNNKLWNIKIIYEQLKSVHYLQLVYYYEMQEQVTTMCKMVYCLCFVGMYLSRVFTLAIE